MRERSIPGCTKHPSTYLETTRRQPQRQNVGHLKHCKKFWMQHVTAIFKQEKEEQNDFVGDINLRPQPWLRACSDSITMISRFFIPLLLRFSKHNSYINLEVTIWWVSTDSSDWLTRLIPCQAQAVTGRCSAAKQMDINHIEFMTVVHSPNETAHEKRSSLWCGTEKLTSLLYAESTTSLELPWVRLSILWAKAANLIANIVRI